jgi:Mg-chelatase subunit ChlD
MSTRDYYVVHSNDHGWHVKLENGRAVDTSPRKQKTALEKAKRLARRNNRGVVVNAKKGYTRRHIDREDL